MLKCLVLLDWCTNRYRLRACAECSRLVGLDRITNTYHIANLGRDLPCITFTNLYHRRLGLTIGLGLEVTVGRWATVIRVDNVEDRENHPKWWHGGGRCQKEKNF